MYTLDKYCACGAGNNAKRHGTQADIIDVVVDVITKQAESCDYLQELQIQKWQFIVLIDFMTTLTPGRFQSYLFRDFSIARIKMGISPFIFEYDQ